MTSLFRVGSLDGILYFATLLVESQRSGKFFPTFSPFLPLFWWTIPSVVVSIAHVVESDQQELVWFIFEISCGIVVAVHLISENMGTWLPFFTYIIVSQQLFRFLPILFCFLSCIIMWNEKCSGKMMLMCFAAGLSTLSWFIHSQNSLGSLILAPIATEFSLYALSVFSHCDPCWRDYEHTHWGWHIVLYLTGLRCVNVEKWERHIKKKYEHENHLQDLQTTGVWWIDSKYGLPVVGRFMHGKKLSDGSISFDNIFADSLCFKCNVHGFFWCYLDGLSIPIRSKMRQRGSALEIDSLFLFLIRLPTCLTNFLGLNEQLNLDAVCLKNNWSRCKPEHITRVLIATETIHRRLSQAILLVYFVNFC